MDENEKEARQVLTAFVSLLQEKMTRADLQEVLEGVQHGCKCDDSYSEAVVERLLGGWRMSDLIEKKSSEVLLKARQENDDTRDKLTRIYRATSGLPDSLRSLAQAIEEAKLKAREGT